MLSRYCTKQAQELAEGTTSAGRGGEAAGSWFTDRAERAGILSAPPARALDGGPAAPGAPPTHHPGEGSPENRTDFAELAAAVRAQLGLAGDVRPLTLDDLAAELAAGSLEDGAVAEYSRRILAQLIRAVETVTGQDGRGECSRLCYAALRVNGGEIGEQAARAALEAADASWVLSGGAGEALADSHPVWPLVAAALKRERVVEPANVRRGAMLPALHRARPDEAETARLLAFDPDPEPGDQLAIPLGLGGRNGEACPAWLLEAFDAAGGRSLAAGGGSGAPWPLRLFVGAILHAPYAARDGYGRWLMLPASDVIRWLHPDGWKNQRSRWRQFPDALRQLDQLRVYIPGTGSVRLVAADVIPRSPEERVAFRFVIPTGAASGARVDWPTLCEYGRESAALYRAYLSASAVLDYTAHKGEPARAGGGQLERMVPTFAADELARMAGYCQDRKSRQRALAAFGRLADDGVIDLQPFGNGWRILGPQLALQA